MERSNAGLLGWRSRQTTRYHSMSSEVDHALPGHISTHLNSNNFKKISEGIELKLSLLWRFVHSVKIMKLVSRMYDDLHGYQIIYHHMPTFTLCPIILRGSKLRSNRVEVVEVCKILKWLFKTCIWRLVYWWVLWNRDSQSACRTNKDHHTALLKY